MPFSGYLYYLNYYVGRKQTLFLIYAFHVAFWLTGHVFIQQHFSSEDEEFEDLLWKSLVSFCHFGLSQLSSKKMFYLGLHQNFAMLISISLTFTLTNTSKDENVSIYFCGLWITILFLQNMFVIYKLLRRNDNVDTEISRVVLKKGRSCIQYGC